MDSGRTIIYADEATFQATYRPGKTWMGGQRLVVPRNWNPLRSVTVFGAVSSSLQRPVFLTGTATNAEEFNRFIDHLVEHTSNLAGRPVLVLDNHRAHKTRENILKMEHHFEVVFQPAYSSEANAQETVWSIVKAYYLKRLYKRDRNLELQQNFHRFVFKTLNKVSPKLQPAQIVKAPLWWLKAH